jgi:hypothetical protein
MLKKKICFNDIASVKILFYFDGYLTLSMLFEIRLKIFLKKFHVVFAGFRISETDLKLSRLSKTGVSNLNWSQGHILEKKCYAGRSL